MNKPNARFNVVVTHGEFASTFTVVDSEQPEAEQPAIVRAWNNRNEPNAAYLARDFCARHNI